jgi:hypothetical protein
MQTTDQQAIRNAIKVRDRADLHRLPRPRRRRKWKGGRNIVSLSLPDKANARLDKLYYDMLLRFIANADRNANNTLAVAAGNDDALVVALWRDPSAPLGVDNLVLRGRKYAVGSMRRFPIAAVWCDDEDAALALWDSFGERVN